MALNALRVATAKQDDRDAREYLADVGFKALPGYVRDVKDYEIALLKGQSITETSDSQLNQEAFALMNGIAGAVFQASQSATRGASLMNPDVKRGKGRRR